MISHEIRPVEDTLVAVVIKLMLFCFYFCSKQHGSHEDCGWADKLRVCM